LSLIGATSNLRSSPMAYGQPDSRCS